MLKKKVENKFDDKQDCSRKAESTIGVMINCTGFVRGMNCIPTKMVIFNVYPLPPLILDWEEIACVLFSRYLAN